MSKIKHNKIKNTGILFELLTRQITADILEGKDNNKSASVSLVKEFFSKNTSMGKELDLIKLLSETKYKSVTKAEQLIELTLTARKKISNSKLRNEKYNLIKKIRENYNPTDFFKTTIPNYKLYASIYKLFETRSEDSATINDIISSKSVIIENITSKKVTKKFESEKLKEFKEQNEDVRLLTYKVLVDNFNKKYNGLDESQRKLLKMYINNVANTGTLKEFISKEVVNIKKYIKDNISKVDDKIVKIKLSEASKLLEKLNSGGVVKDSQVVSLMRWYQLVKEIKDVVSTK